MAIIRRIASLFLILIVAIPSIAFASEDKVIAYYFHGSFRCPTCYKMEQYTKEVIEENFKDELDSGLLVFNEVNVEEKENEHFLSDYQLYTKSLIISYVKNGKETQHKNLTKIWEYVRNKKQFFNYVTTEINSYLGNAQ